MRHILAARPGVCVDRRFQREQHVPASGVVGPETWTAENAWKNTNHLLAVEGYDGVKTSTTAAAGVCLVACGSREGRELLVVVVLDASNSDARDVDSRNLFRWAWRHSTR